MLSKLSKNKVLSMFIQEVWNERNADAAERYIAPSYTVHQKQIKMSGATVYYFTNDRIDGHWQIVDRLGVLQQLRSTT